MNNFEDIANRRVDIREDIKRYQDTLSRASSKVASNINLKIKTGTVGYNNKILLSDGKFNLGKNENVNLTVPAIKSHKSNSLMQKPNISHKKQEPTHNEEKIAFVLFITGGFAIWNIFR